MTLPIGPLIVADDDLQRFEADGAPALPETETCGHVETDGARIWYASYGTGIPVVLLHGGLGHAGNWGYQVETLIANGYRTVVIDSRGHGRSTRDAQPLGYEQMAADVIAVMDALQIQRAVFAGWSDGATTSLVIAMQHPDRVAGVFFFAGNMDPSGVKAPDPANPVIDRIFARHVRDYAALSATPDDFQAFAATVNLMMTTQPNYTEVDLAVIRVPVAVAHSESDEFITREHAERLVRCMPRAHLLPLTGVTHFAPLQRPEYFNAALIGFVAGVIA
jgi:pimeloyl-ACP methyl ester carboxylesterase